MNRTSGVVEINGNRYDASTGQMLGTVKKSANHLRSSATGVIDGIIKHSSQVSAKKKAVSHRAKHTAQTFHKSTQRSRTLMRTAVSKPAQSKTIKHSSNQASSTASSVAKKQFYRGSAHAKTVSLDNKVSRFGHVNKTALNHPKPKSNEVVSRRSPEIRAKTPVYPSMITSASHSQVERLLDQALASSLSASNRPRSAHGLLHRIRLLPRRTSVVATALAIAGIFGFFAWQNIPEVAVKVAASRANVNASVPGFAPEGYNFAAPIHYAKGQVSLNYKSDNGQSYQITQQSSKMDSAALASNVLSTEPNVQTSQVKGNTIYIYGEKNHATWVNNGVRYTITDKAGLDSSQILEIAGSL